MSTINANEDWSTDSGWTTSGTVTINSTSRDTTNDSNALRELLREVSETKAEVEEVEEVEEIEVEVEVEEVKKELELILEQKIRGWKRKGFPIQEKRSNNKRKLFNVNNQDISDKDILIGKTKRGILSYSGPPFTVVTNDSNLRGNVEKLSRNTYTSDGKSLCPVKSGILIDKNINILSLFSSKRYYFNSSPLFQNIQSTFTKYGHFRRNICIENGGYLIIDKKKFIESEGKIFSIKNKYGFSYYEIIRVKKELGDYVRKSIEFVRKIKSIVGKIYDEEYFDIIYEISFTYTDSFEIRLHFPKVTIRNSIEMEHTIHNLTVSLLGYHEMTNESYTILTKLRGIRSTFSVRDAYYGYVHSHIQSGIINEWRSFCIGRENLFEGIKRKMTDVDLEAALIAVYDHVSWESLEGGPYVTMENIGRRSTPISTNETQPFLDNYRSTPIKRLLNKLNKKDISALLKAFSIIPDEENGDMTYSVDKDMFNEVFVNLFTTQEVKEILDESDINWCTYSTDDKKFRLLNNMKEFTETSSTRKEVAKKKVRKIEPVYMNGAYILPKVLEEEKDDKEELKMILCVEPTIITIIRKYIHYHLINELANNDKEQEQEQGKSSSSNKREGEGTEKPEG